MNIEVLYEDNHLIAVNKPGIALAKAQPNAAKPGNFSA